ncbi:MAG: RNA-binding domain-containing protein [Pseudoxanthomonas sp.]
MATAQRLSDLLREPLESPECEIKNWLDLKDSNHDKATFAKAVIALANSGGGFIIIGLAKTETGFATAPDRPADLTRYDQDLLNGSVQSYCDPAMHCAVHFVAGPDESLFPIVVVPGGHRVPIRAKRGGPENKVMAANDIFVRKPGPRSETPTCAQDWDDLLGRCMQNRRDELLDRMRELLSGAITPPPPAPQPERLPEWVAASRSRWLTLTRSLPANVGPRMPHGRYTVAYEIIGERKPVTLAQLPDIIRTSTVRHTGWPPFWFPNRPGIAPHAIDGAVECWIGGDPDTNPAERDAAHADYWRIHPDGLAFLLRGFKEDGMDQRERRPYLPGAVFDVTIPVWRVGECLLQAQRLAINLFEGPSSIKFWMLYEGLAGRELVSLDGSKILFDGKKARQDTMELSTHVDTAVIASSLPEIVHPFLSPLYTLFDFFELPKALVDAELAKMRGSNPA